MSDTGEIYTAGKNFTLPPALTTWTNSTSANDDDDHADDDDAIDGADDGLAWMDEEGDKSGLS